MHQDEKMKVADAPKCPHCGHNMKKWKVPVNSTWADDFFYVCFNDACPYFVQGWTHMQDQQQTRASYRCRLDPDSGKFVPLPVWSSEALKDDIIE